MQQASSGTGLAERPTETLEPLDIATWVEDALGVTLDETQRFVIADIFPGQKPAPEPIYVPKHANRWLKLPRVHSYEGRHREAE